MKLLDSNKNVVGNIKSYTRFMNGYRSSSVLHSGSNIVSVSSEDSLSNIIFTNDDTGTIHCYIDKTGGTTGVVEAEICGQGKRLTAFRRPDGKMAVLSAAGDKLYYIEEEKKGSRTFKEPVKLKFAASSDIKEIEAFYVKTIKDGIAVAYLTSSFGSKSKLLYYAVVKNEVPEFIRTDMSYGTLVCSWTGDNQDNLCFCSYNGIVTRYNVKSKHLIRYTNSNALDGLKVKPIKSDDGTELVIAIVQNKTADICVLKFDDDNLECLCIPISEKISFMEITAVNCAGNIHIMAVSNNEKLYHSCINKDFKSVQTFVEIASGIRVISSDLPNDNGFCAYAVGVNQNLLGCLDYNSINTNWNCEWLELENDAVISEFECYSTEIYIYDSEGHPLKEEPITLSASPFVKMDIRGGIHWIDENHKFSTMTDLQGKITIIQETEQIVTSDIKINAPRLMHSNEEIVIKPYSEVEEKIHNLTTQELKDAKKKDGYLVSEKYRNNDELLNAVTGVLNKVTDLTKSKYMTRSNDVLSGRKIVAPDNFMGWSIKFYDSTAVYAVLDDMSLDEKINMIKSGCLDATSNGFFSKIGDFFRSVVKKVVEVVEIVVYKVKELVKSVITFIADGVKYFFDTIVEFVEDVMEIAEIIFSEIEVFFKDLFEWIAFIFNWNDILRTKEVISYTVVEGLKFVKGASKGVSKLINNKMSEIQKDIDKLFDAAVNSLIGKYSFNECTSKDVPKDENVQIAASNNFLMDKLIENSNVAVMQSEFAVNGVIDDILNRLVSIAKECVDSGNLNEAIKYFKEACTSLERFFTCTIAGLLKVLQAIINSAINGLKAVVEILFGVIETVVQSIIDLIKKEIKIPFINEFYKFISGGSNISILDVLSLVMAIPTTIFYKIVKNKALFADDASVQRFKNEINAENLLKASGLLTESFDDTLILQHTVAVASEEAQVICKVFGSLGVFWFFSLSAVNDIGPGVFVLGVAQVVFETLWQSCTCPWIYKNASVYGDTPESRECKQWIFCWVGISFDTVWLIVTRNYPDSEDWGRIITTCYGLLHLMVVLDSFGDGDGKAIASNCICITAEVSKIALHSSNVAETEGISLAVGVALDLIAAVSLAILNVV